MRYAYPPYKSNEIYTNKVGWIIPLKTTNVILHGAKKISFSRVVLWVFIIPTQERGNEIRADPNYLFEKKILQ